MLQNFSYMVFALHEGFDTPGQIYYNHYLMANQTRLGLRGSVGIGILSLIQ
jgi:hypothetical protein